MKKRTSRWDQKSLLGESDNLGWQEWKRHNHTSPQSRNIDIPSENVDAQAPLDYSTESRSRAEAMHRNSDNSQEGIHKHSDHSQEDMHRHSDHSQEAIHRNSDNSQEAMHRNSDNTQETMHRNSDNSHEVDHSEKIVVDQLPQNIIPPLFPLYSNYTSFPSSSRISSIPFPPPTWQHPEQYFMNNSSYNMKWWNQENPPPNQFGHSSQYDEKEKKNYDSYNINSIGPKEQPSFYNDYHKRYPRSKSPFQKLPIKENQFQAEHLQYDRSKYKIDNMKDIHGQGNFPLATKYSVISNNSPNKDFNSRYTRKKDNCLKLRKGEKMSVISKQMNFLPFAQKGKSISISKSAAEEANLKAFDLANNSLKQAYLAAKNSKVKDHLKIVKTKSKVSKSHSIPSNSDHFKPTATDLTYRKEFWQSFNNKGTSKSKMNEIRSSNPPRNLSKNINLLNTIIDSEGSISELTESSRNLTLISSKRRKRCLSDSYLSSSGIKCLLDKSKILKRSSSCSDVNISKIMERKDLRSTILGRVKGLVVEHLLKVDKGKIQELLNKTVVSKKLKWFMESLTDDSGSHFAEKLLNERMMFASNSIDERDDIEVSAHMDILSDDVLSQVKEILDMEANGEGNSNWDEISLSIADLISGSIQKNQYNFTSESNQNNHLESEIEILTPPPKTPATMITLADSDTDFHPSNSINGSPLPKDLFNPSTISHEMSCMSLSPSSIGTTCLLPIIPTLTDNIENEEIASHLEEVTGDKNNLEENRNLSKQDLQEDTLCDITIQPSLVKVKEERPSPISECSLCMHSARSPHTPQCGFAYNMASSPVPLISGHSRSLSSSARRPVRPLPNDFSRIFNHVKSEGATFLSLENIDRPSSEERPKNPAPPDTTSNEPPSPLSIPPPESTVHPSTARQILFSDNGFTEPMPPRPQPPPPLEHSPPIKFERRTPTSSFCCICLRSDCDRSEHSDFHRPNHRRTPHGQLREARGSHMYKMEAPYIPSARARTPHRMINLFTMPTSRPRCIIPNNDTSPTASIQLPAQETCIMVNTGVQTECSNIPKLVDKSTNINTLPAFSTKSDMITNDDHQVINNGSEPNNKIFSRIDSLMREVTGLTMDHNKNPISFQQNLTLCEDRAIEYLSMLKEQEMELFDRKTKLIETLRDIVYLRRNEIINGSNLNKETVEKAVNTDDVNICVVSPNQDMNGKFLKMEAIENTSIVSSSQEGEPRLDLPSNKYDLHSEQLDSERCISTSGLDMVTINEGENSTEFESFVKEEHAPQEFEVNSECCDIDKEIESSLKEGSEQFRSLQLSTINNETPEVFHIENDPQSKNINSVQSCSDDIIIMGDITHRKIVLMSPLSPKTRNSSGSEHGYSLRSRGPPSDSYDYNSDSNQLMKEAVDIGNFITDCSPPKRRPEDGCFNNGNPDAVINLDSSDIPEESSFKKKRKRKTKKLGSSKKKRKKFFDFENLVNLSYNSNSTDGSNLSQENRSLILPAQIESSILTIKIAGNYLFSGCGDCSVRVYDMSTGKLFRIYSDHLGPVSSLLVLGQPNYASDLSKFTLVTGSEDQHIRIFDGKSGNLKLKMIATEPITCLEYRWKYVFIGTQGGCCIKWNLKDKKLGEKISFSEKVITCLVPHTEGGRRVLIVAAKTFGLMVRDAMSGLFLRSLQYSSFTVYTGVFDGNLLYAAGSETKIYVYDFCSGAIIKQINTFSAISSLLLCSNNIIATCYDGFIRIINLTDGQLTNTLPVESSHKMFTCSFLYKNQIILSNKHGEIVSCKLPWE